MKKLTSAVVASSLVLGLVGTALAAPTADEQQASYARMEALKLVQGTDRGPELDGTLTRAQLLTIIVRAFQYETAAKASMAVGSFSDVPGGQWYSGYVAVAKTLAEERGFAIGYPDGTFKPNNPVTVIEALAMIMKFLGVPVGTGDNWVAQTIENAKAYGVITDADVEKYFADPNAAATRGVAIALADQIFSTYKVAGTDKTVYTYYVDTQAPVISVDPIGTPTVDVAEVTIKGKIEGANKAYVTTQSGEQLEITLGADGSFSVVVPLVAGENRIVISATDIAGNYAEYVVPVNRVAGAPAAIKVESTEIELIAGETVELEYAVVDASGLELADAKENVKLTVSEEVGVLNEDGTITVAQQVGEGTIVLSYEGLEDVVLNVKVVPAELESIALEIDGERVPSAAQSETVTLVAVDAYGNKIDGAVFTEDDPNAVIEGDKFTAFKPGVYKVTVTVGEGEEAVSKEAEVAVYGEIADLKITAPTRLVRNNETKYTVTVTAVDKNGAVVRDFNGWITLDGEFNVQDPKSVRAKNGVATFKITVPENLKAGYLIATYETDEETIEAELEVETTAQEATAIKITAGDYLGLNKERTLPWEGKIEVVDQEGVAMLDEDEEWDVTIEVDGPAYISEDPEEHDKDKVLEVTVEGNSSAVVYLHSRDDETEGTITITATAEGLKSATKTVKAVWAERPRKLTLEKAAAIDGDTTVYVIGLTDRNDVPVIADDNYEVTLTFNTNDVAVATKGAYQKPSKVDAKYISDAVAAPAVADKKTKVTFEKGDAYLYIVVDNKKPGEKVNMKASITGFTSASADLEFKVGDPEGVKFDKWIANRNGETEKVEFQIVDGFGLPVAKSLKIRLVTDASDRIRVNGKRSPATVTITTDSNGKATAELTPEWNMSWATIEVWVDLDDKGNFTKVGEINVVRADNEAEEIEVKAYANGVDYTDTKRLPDSVTKDLYFVLDVTDRRGRPMPSDYDPAYNIYLTIKENSKVLYEDWAAELGDWDGYEFTPYANVLDDLIAGGTYEFIFTDVYSVYVPEGSFKFSVFDESTVAFKLAGDKTSAKGDADNPVDLTLTVQTYNGTDVNLDEDVTVTVEIEGDGWLVVNGKLIRNGDKFKITADADEAKVKVYGDPSDKDVKFTFTASGLQSFEFTLTK